MILKRRCPRVKGEAHLDSLVQFDHVGVGVARIERSRGYESCAVCAYCRVRSVGVNSVDFYAFFAARPEIIHDLLGRGGAPEGHVHVVHVPTVIPYGKVHFEGHNHCVDYLAARRVVGCVEVDPSFAEAKLSS